jgi:hypothetical protein
MAQHRVWIYAKQLPKTRIKLHQHAETVEAVEADEDLQHLLAAGWPSQ